MLAHSVNIDYLTSSNSSSEPQIRSALDTAVFVLSCAFIYGMFEIIRSYTDGNRKSSAWIIMLVSSPILSIVGTIFVLTTEWKSSWTNSFIYGEDYISRAVIVFFIASNFCDLVIGYFYYLEYLDPFTTIFHHIAYIVFMIGLLQANISRGFLLCFFMEIPTFFISLGTVFKDFRSDLMFGITFFITRLMFNLYLIVRLATITNYEGVIWKICTFVLIVHIYWFYKWYNTYGKNVLKTVLKDCGIE